jgi:hypothetical protein
VPNAETREEIVRNRRNGERGVALLLTLFALMIVTAIGFSMMFQTDTETAINANFRDQQAGYYAAAAGLEEGRDRMRSDAGVGVTINLPTVLPGAAANGVLYVTNALNGETVAPWSTSNAYFDNELCVELNCSGGLVPPTPGWYVNPAPTANAAYAANPVMPYKWVRITRKINRSARGALNVMNMYVNGGTSGTFDQAVCWDGTREIVLSGGCTATNLPVYLVTTLAVTSSGARRMLQYELTQQEPLTINFPAGMTLAGSSSSLATVNGLNSDEYNVEGNDHAGCGGAAVAAPVAAIGVGNNADVANVISGIPSNRLDHYTGVGAAPDVENVSASMPAEFQSVSALEALLATIKSKPATQYLKPIPPATAVTTLSNPGTSYSPQTIYVDGDLTLSGSLTGYGILVVTGTFSPGGNVGWRGVVLVVGQGIITGNGGGNNEYDGALVVAKTRDSSGNVLSTLGTPTYDWSGGGGNGIKYSSGCISQAQTFTDHKILSTRELAY